MKSPVLRAVLFIMLSTLGIVLATDETEQPGPASTIETWQEGQNASGNWFGLRDLLADHGVFFNGSITMDLLGNPVGGEQRGFAYFHELQLQLILDLDRLVGWKGAWFVFSAFDNAGSDLSGESIGNLFTVAETVTINTFVLYQLFIQQDLFDDNLRIKVGRVSAGEDFATLDVFGLYVNAFINSHPGVIGSNVAFLTAPQTTWGFSSVANLQDDLSVKFGIFQADSRANETAYRGADFSIRPEDGTTLLWELEWRPEFFARAGSDSKGKTAADPGYAGTWQIGAYYSNWSYDEFLGGGTAYENFGFYAQGQQLVWREKPGSDEGITVWTSFSYAPQENIAQFTFFNASGVAWQGIIPARDNDFAIFASYIGTVSPDFARANEFDDDGSYNGFATAEWVLEFGYRIALTPWCYIQPDAQWIIRPGGTGNIPNALVLGGEIGVTF